MIHTIEKLDELKKVFNVLSNYYAGDNPFSSNTLKRNLRKEQEHVVKRISFSREQEEQIREVLDNENYQIANKSEMKVVYYLGMFTGQRMKDCVLLRCFRKCYRNR